MSKKRRKRQQCIIAFHCQQCIEKYLKALLTKYRLGFPWHHDLEELLVLLLEKEPLLSVIRDSLKNLTPFAVIFRYPGEDVTLRDVKEAVSIMKKLRIVLREYLM